VQEDVSVIKTIKQSFGPSGVTAALSHSS